MNKVLSLIIFAAALSWTWNIVYSESAIGFETHSGIQVKLTQIIVDTLAQKKPDAKDMVVHKLWTEAVNENKVKAHFAYKFNEIDERGETIETVIAGEAILHREPTDEPGKDLWIIQSVNTNSDAFVFNEGSTISPNTETEADKETGVEEDPADASAATPTQPEENKTAPTSSGSENNEAKH